MHDPIKVNLDTRAPAPIVILMLASPLSLYLNLCLVVLIVLNVWTSLLVHSAVGPAKSGLSEDDFSGFQSSTF
jgi:hypothetical protein